MTNYEIQKHFVTFSSPGTAVSGGGKLSRAGG